MEIEEQKCDWCGDIATTFGEEKLCCECYEKKKAMEYFIGYLYE